MKNLSKKSNGAPQLAAIGFFIGLFISSLVVQATSDQARPPTLSPTTQTKDTDKDGVPDDVERLVGTDPLDPTSFKHPPGVSGFQNKQFPCSRVGLADAGDGTMVGYSNCVGMFGYLVGSLPVPFHIPDPKLVANYLVTTGYKGPYTPEERPRLPHYFGVVVWSGKLLSGEPFYHVGLIVESKPLPGNDFELTIANQPGAGAPFGVQTVRLSMLRKALPPSVPSPEIYYLPYMYDVEFPDEITRSIF